MADSLGHAPGLALAFVYFSVATTAIAGLQRHALALALSNAFDAFAWACVESLPVFLVAWILELAPKESRLRRAGLAVLLAALSTHVLCSSIDFLAQLYFHQRLSTGIVFVFAETNLAESRAFIGGMADRDLLWLAAFLTAPIALAWTVRAGARTAPRMAASALVLFASAHGVYASHTMAPPYNPSVAFGRGFAAYREELRAYQELATRLDASAVKGAVAATSSADRNLTVLVLGESTNRNHMGLYGYERDTTPRLSGMGDLLVFDDVVSPHSHTIPSLQKLLTWTNTETAGPWYEQPLLLDVMKAAGYRTYWISNQEAYGTFGNISSAFAARADVRIFNNRGSSENPEKGLDGDLLAYLDRILERDPAPDKFVVLHLMGTHGSYRERYPPTFRRFEAEDVAERGRDFLLLAHRRLIAEYDNAVLYNDWVVASIVERVRQQGGSAQVIYTADHGEEVFDTRDFMGHTEKIGNRHMIEVPFLVWLSDDYRSANPDRVAALRANTDAPYMTDDLVHTLLDLASVRFDRNEPRRSLARAKFDRGRRRLYAGRDYDRELRTDTPRIEIRDHFDKLWAHRVDSLGKLEQLQPIYAGVELDVVFESRPGGARFDVNHPPAESIGLSLDEYWARAHTEKLRFWLDWKNLTADNAAPALEHLGALLDRYGLTREQVIVESTEASALGALADGPFLTSYYLPAEVTDEMAGEIARQARDARVDAISFPGELLDYVRRNLRPRLDGIRLYTWFPTRTLANPLDAPFLQHVIDDPAIDVVLIGHRTKFDR